MSLLLTPSHVILAAQRMKIELQPLKPTFQNLSWLAHYIEKTNLDDGYIITRGNESIAYKNHYPLKKTHLWIAKSKNHDQILGFVLWSQKFNKKNHAHVNINHPNFQINKHPKISVILDICSISSSYGVKGVGTLLMYLALSQSEPHGTVLFVSKKPVYENYHGKSVLNYITSQSAMNFYNKMKFKTVDGFNDQGIPMNVGSKIQYRSCKPTEEEFFDNISKYFY